MLTKKPLTFGGDTHSWTKLKVIVAGGETVPGTSQETIDYSLFFD